TENVTCAVNANLRMKGVIFIMSLFCFDQSRGVLLNRNDSVETVKTYLSIPFTKYKLIHSALQLLGEVGRAPDSRPTHLRARGRRVARVAFGFPAFGPERSLNVGKRVDCL